MDPLKEIYKQLLRIKSDIYFDTSLIPHSGENLDRLRKKPGDTGFPEKLTSLPETY